MNAIIEAHYLPSLEYFCALLPHDEIIVEGYENFVKQTYRNRCFIKTAHGVKILTVPLVGRHGKLLSKDVQIETGDRWRNNHWRTIESAYRKAPYFDYYSEDLKNILYQGHQFLVDLDLDLLSFCLQQCGCKKKITVSVAYQAQPLHGVTDLRSLITDKKPTSLRKFFRTHSYYQVFGSDFASNLSIIDLLFCEGPSAMSLLEASSAF